MQLVSSALLPANSALGAPLHQLSFEDFHNILTAHAMSNFDRKVLARVDMNDCKYFDFLVSTQLIMHEVETPGFS